MRHSALCLAGLISASVGVGMTHGGAAGFITFGVVAILAGFVTWVIDR